MSFLVTGYGSYIDDYVSSIENTLGSAFETAEEYLEDNYEIEITKVESTEGDFTDSFTELLEMLQNHGDYDEFMESAEDYVLGFINEYNLKEYIERYYISKNSLITFESNHKVIKLDFNYDEYQSVLKMATECNETVSSFIKRTILERRC